MYLFKNLQTENYTYMQNLFYCTELKQYASQTLQLLIFLIEPTCGIDLVTRLSTDLPFIFIGIVRFAYLPSQKLYLKESIKPRIFSYHCSKAKFKNRANKYNFTKCRLTAVV